MEKKDLSLNIEFVCNGNKGRIIKIEKDFFTILWIDKNQKYDYPYNEILLKSMVLTEKEKVKHVDKNI